MKRRELRVVRGNDKFTFSTGGIVEALQGSGIPTDNAIRLARTVEKHYRNSSKSIKLSELVERLHALILKDFGEALAQRFMQGTPPFVPLLVMRANDEVPFSRRILAESLGKQDLSFKEAHAVAQHVEQHLRTEGFEQVTERELMHYTLLALEGLLGRERRLKHETRLRGLTDVGIIEADGSRFPYSRGILAQSLMAVGLGPEMSHALAKRIEETLWREGKSAVTRQHLRGYVKALLYSEAGEEFARRYDLLKSVRSPNKPIIILIGGAPGVGKSTLAAELAYRLGIPRLVSSDSVRQALRSLISAELSPALHASSFTAWQAELLPGERETARPKRKRVIRGFQRQVMQLGTALKAIMTRNTEEATSLVMEGIHLVPGFIPTEELTDAIIVEIVVAVRDPETHRRYFNIRDAQTQQRRSLEKYMKHFEEIRILQDFMVERAEDQGVTVIDGSNFEGIVDRAIDTVLNAVLLERQESEDEPVMS